MKISSLTPLRFFAALVVVFFHYGSSLICLPEFLFQGPEMVTFFFVLSGFVLAIAYSGRTFHSADFLLNRIARIGPAYFLALSVVVLGNYIQGELHAYDLLLSVFFLQSWVPDYALVLNSPGWSLSVEMFFYLTFPFIFALFNSWRKSPAILFFACLVFWFSIQVIVNTSLIQDLGINDYLNYFPPMHLSGFVLGIAGGKLFIERPDLLHRLNGLGVVLSCMLLSLLLLNFTHYIKPYIDTANGLLSPIFVLLIIAVAINDCKLSYLKGRTMLLLGEASYAFYLLQVPVHGILQRTLLPLIPDQRVGFVVYLLALLLISIIVYRLFELPASRVIKTLYVKNFKPINS